jgi:hypothetical protein
VAVGWLGTMSPARAVPVGFNQAWFENHYGNQYLDEAFDPAAVERIFKLAKKGGADQVRLWFFETMNYPMLNWSPEGHITGIREDYVRNVIRMLTIARDHQIRIYMTLLDPQVYRPDQRDQDHSRFKRILSQAGGHEFLERALAPMLKTIQEAGLADRISRIDLANEMDAAVNRFAFEGGWNGASRFLCQWRAFIRSRPGFETTPVSASLRLHPMLWLPGSLFDSRGSMACADFLDFHSYSDSGKIHRCGEILRYSKRNEKPVILGEFGQAYFTRRYSDDLQVRNTRNYIDSANACGFKEALAWRLSDIREGENPEARYSFEAFGTTRPAFELIREENSRVSRP